MDPAAHPGDRFAGRRLVRCCIGLGSNLGDRVAHLAAAEAALRRGLGSSDLEMSGIYETAPVGPGRQAPYLNAAARFTTSLTARDLLAQLLAVEARRGRERSGPRYSARTLDLDLLLYGDQVIAEAGLVVPHPELHRRAFVLEPLSEIAAELVHPTLGERIQDLAAALRDPDSVRRVGDSLVELPAKYSTVFK